MEIRSIFGLRRAAKCGMLLLSIALLLGRPGVARSQGFEHPTLGTIAPEDDPNNPNKTPQERFEAQRRLIARQIQIRGDRERKVRIDKVREEEQTSRNQDLEARKAAVSALAAQPVQPPQGPPGARPGARPGVRPGARPGAPAGAAPAPQESTLAVLAKGHIPHVTFYLTPANFNVFVGQRFATRCMLLNADNLKVDSIDILLDYPAHNIQPTAVHQDVLEPVLAGAPDCQIDEDRGVLRYKARFKEPIEGVDINLLTIEWAAVEPVRSAWIRPFKGERYTSVYHGDELLTYASLGRAEAVSGARFQIMAPAGEAPAGPLTIGSPTSRLPVLVGGAADQTGLRLPTLWIDQPGQGLLEPDQWYVVDLGIDNPDGRVFDEVRLAARFDPEAVEIADTDKDNWIERGRNLLDSPFHELWPWDRHYINRIDSQAGYFYYRMGTSALREQPSGPVARLFVKVKKPTPAPIFTWMWNPGDLPERPTTGLYLLGENLYRRVRENDQASAPVGTDSATVAENALAVEKADPKWYRY